MVEKGVKELASEYLAGAALAFGFVFFTREVFLIYFTSTGAIIEVFNRDLIGLSAIIHIVGGFLGGHLVSRTRSEEILRAGATTTLFAYILEYIVDILFIGDFTNGLWIAIFYLVGGGLGATYSNYLRWGKILEPRREKTRESEKIEEPIDIDRIQDLIERSSSILRDQGYETIAIDPLEFVDFAKGSNELGNEITLNEVLKKRYLTIHEVVVISELKKIGKKTTQIDLLTRSLEVYEAHLIAFELELSLALKEENPEWVRERINLIESWIKDNTVPDSLVQSFMALKNKFTNN